MIPRYQTPEIVAIWAEERKFQLWLEVELAVLDARASLGLLDSKIAEQIRAEAQFDLKRIEEIEAETQHDLLAFVQAVQENLDPQIQGEFHRGMTSYDTEEIPTNLRVRDSLDIVIEAVTSLNKVIARQAAKHKQTLMIGRTHGQQAEPITFGFKMLGWLAACQRDYSRLTDVKSAISIGKISGAVGVYGDLDPQLEAEVCQRLGLKSPDHATQVLHRDRIAQVMTTLAILAGDIENVAQDFRLMAQTEICEVREPFGRKQKGSSIMPHKKNTIVTERLCGLSRLVRGNCLAALEEIATWSERDISQSSVERIILPDTFHLVHYMLQKLTWVLDEMEVFPKNMQRNLELTRGCIYSGRVKDLLLNWGLEPEFVYRLVQKSAFTAMEQGEDFIGVISKDEAVAPHLVDSKKQELLQSCFNPWQGLRHIDKIFARFGL